MRADEKRTTENERWWENTYWEYALSFRSTEICATNSMLTAANRFTVSCTAHYAWRNHYSEDLVKGASRR